MISVVSAHDLHFSALTHHAAVGAIDSEHAKPAQVLAASCVLAVLQERLERVIGGGKLEALPRQHTVENADRHRLHTSFCRRHSRQKPADLRIRKSRFIALCLHA